MLQDLVTLRRKVLITVDMCTRYTYYSAMYFAAQTHYNLLDRCHNSHLIGPEGHLREIKVLSTLRAHQSFFP